MTQAGRLQEGVGTPISLDAARSAAGRGLDDARWFPRLRRALPGLVAEEIRWYGVPLGGPMGTLIAVDPGETVRVPLGGPADAVVLATCCAPAADRVARDASEDEADDLELTSLGEVVATVTLRYADGGEEAWALRRRFETGPPSPGWGHAPFIARPHRPDVPLDPAGPYGAGSWGWHQTAVSEGDDAGPCFWLSAWRNPRPGVALAELVVQATGATVLLGGGATWVGPGDPLALPIERRLAIEGLADPGAFEVVDGTLIRALPVAAYDAARWVAGPATGYGDPDAAPGTLIVEVVTSPRTSLAFAGAVVEPFPLAAGDSVDVGGCRVRSLHAPAELVHVELVDERGPAAARVHLRSSDGQELSPVDRARIASDRWFEDPGLDAVLGRWRYAYVEGSFDVLVPPGSDLLVEAVHGPAHAVARHVHPASGGSSAVIRLERIVDPRAAGWRSSDTHVHFVPPGMLRRQAMAEDLDLAHLMGAQWGELFTNIEHLEPASGAGADGSTVIAGTENRHHALGHLLAAGVTTVRPLSTGGAAESMLADPTRITVGDWAAQARAGGGLAILAHFPYPYLECVASLLLGEIDAIELWFRPTVDSHLAREWYRLLGLGIRVPLLSGTDKMESAISLGSTRTWVHVGPDDRPGLEAWMAAVRAGRTIASNGPILDIRIDGELPGATLADAPGRHRSLEWRLASAVPVRCVEVVANGEVIRSVPVDGRVDHGAVEFEAPAAGWLAVRARSDTSFRKWGEPWEIGAHTSPWYLPRRAAPVTADVERFLRHLDGALGWAAYARWGSDEVRDAFVDRMADARERLMGLFADAG